ncbi:MAG: type IX secretion system membrane protein PorP/SprF [Saprospiraceae bacterium]
MSKELNIILFVVAACLNYGNSQQFGINTMYNLDSYLANKATAGLQGQSLISLTYRNQWENLKGSPVNFQANYSMPLRMVNGGYGLHISHRSAGILSTTELGASYNQVWSKADYLVSGAFGLFDQITNLDFNKIRTPEGEYSSNIFDHHDPNLSSTATNQNAIGLNLSIYCQTRILEGGIEFSLPVFHASKHKPSFLKTEHLLKIVLFKEFNIAQWTINASIFDYTDLVENQEEIQANIKYRDQFSGGLLLRGLRPSSLDAIGMQFSFRLAKGVWLAYHFEWPLNVLKNQINSLNQQFGLKFEFNTFDKRKRIPIIYNPRW